MSRRTLLLALVFVCNQALAQVENALPLVDGEVIFTDTVSIQNTSQQELFSRAKAWLAVTFVSAKAVIELQDEQKGRLIVKGSCPLVWPTAVPSNGQLRFTLQIDCRDNRFRYRFTNLVYQIESNRYPPLPIDKTANAKSRTAMKCRINVINAISGLSSSLIKGLSTNDTF